MSNTIPESVQEEQRLLDTVLAAARRAHSEREVVQDYDAQLLRLRDEMVEERLPEDRASILEQMERVAHLKAQAARYAEGILNPQSPYFGHMRLRLDENDEQRDILIGKQTWVRDGIRIVDWRNAPISRVFYQQTQGDDFGIPIARRIMEGEVELRRTVTIREGALRRVSGSRITWVRRDGGWVDESDDAPVLRGGAGAALRPDLLERPALGGGLGLRADKHLPEIASLLDPEQFDLITRPDNGVVAIQGSAGSGKTTVALHRVAWLAFQDAARFDGSKALVVVFSQALASYISQVLPALGVAGVLVRTWEDWAQSIRRRLFRRVPDVYTEDTPVVVTRFKLHSALLPMLVDGYAENSDLSPMDLWDELFTSRAWIARVRQHDPDGFTEKELEVVHRWNADMHFVRADGRGHREHEAPCIDREDDAILLFLHTIVKGPLPSRTRRPMRYGHLVVDEAQDLSPIELEVLRSTVVPNGAITLAGDTAQRLDADNDFRDWAHVLSTLGLDHVQLSPLRITYRSTASIMRLAHDVLGPLAGEVLRTARGDGVPPQLIRFRSRGESMTFLADSLKALVAAEPLASVAVLSRYAWQADEAYRALERADFDALERIADHEFSFAPGVEVAEVRQTKGLEFDYVVIVDADVDTWPSTDSSRHLLHVGVTRAAHQLWLLCVGTPSPLLPRELEALSL